VGQLMEATHTGASASGCTVHVARSAQTTTMVDWIAVQT